MQIEKEKVLILKGKDARRFENAMKNIKFVPCEEYNQILNDYNLIKSIRA